MVLDGRAPSTSNHTHTHTHTVVLDCPIGTEVHPACAIVSIPHIPELHFLCLPGRIDRPERIRFGREMGERTEPWA